MATNPAAGSFVFPKDFQIVDQLGLLTPGWHYFFLQLFNEARTVSQPFGFAGIPVAGASITVPLPYVVTIPPNLDGMTGYAVTPPSSTAVFTVNGINPDGSVTFLGTITFVPGDHFLSSTAGPGGTVSYGAIQIVAPNPADATLAGVVIGLKYTKS